MAAPPIKNHTLKTHEDDHPVPAVAGGHLAKTGEPAPPRDPDQDSNIETVGDEQRKRSAEMMKMGMNAWRDAHDERTPEQIAGMGIPVAGEPAKRLEGGKHS